ncbi:MAG: intradiol ring-cleavage dioxygenase [Actinomycetota bacterium]
MSEQDGRTAAEDVTMRRRDLLVALGAIGAGAMWLASRAGDATARAAVAGAAAGQAQNATCVLTPEQTEGPYWIDTTLTRRDVRAGRPGLPLDLRLTVVDASTCRPIRGADVEIWHCDAAGVYSGVAGGGGNGAASPTDSTRFLRGHQVADAAGRVRFITIYPGWYQGRTVHIHVKVHVKGDEVHTGQLYFPDAVTDAVSRVRPYASRGTRDTRNADDHIYASGGRQSTLRLRRRASGRGYIGSLTMGVDV